MLLAQSYNLLIDAQNKLSEMKKEKDKGVLSIDTYKRNVDQIREWHMKSVFMLISSQWKR